MDTKINFKTIILWFVILFLFLFWLIFFQYISHLNNIPYNVRELIAEGSNYFYSALIMTATCYFIFGVPIIVSRKLLIMDNHIKLYILFFLLIIVLSTIVLFFLLSILPLECIHDIIGSNVLNWFWNMEYIYRFSGIFVGIFSSLMLSSLIILLYDSYRKISLIKVLFVVIFIFSMISYAHWIVVIDASTDNLIELMARRGDWFSSLLFLCWFSTIGFASLLLSKNISINFSSFFISFIFMVLMIPIGFLLFKSASESSLTKYGKNFSALQFLLSTDRSSYIDDERILFYRYCIAHFTFVVLFTVSQIPFWFFLKLQSRR